MTTQPVDASDVVATPTSVPDGQPRYVIAFAPLEGAQVTTKGAPGRIVRYDRSTGEITTVVKASAVADGIPYARIVDADLSPDGSTVAFVANWDDPQEPVTPAHPAATRSGFFRVAADGTSGAQTLFVDEEASNAPASTVEYSPDGQSLAIADVSGLGILPSDGGTVTWNGAAGISLAWSPEGQRLAVALTEDMTTNQRTEVVGFDLRRRVLVGRLNNETVAGVGPWWDADGNLHATPGVETSTRSGGQLAYNLAIDTDATYRWVLGNRGSCWFSDLGSGQPVEPGQACRLDLPSPLRAVSW